MKLKKYLVDIILTMCVVILIISSGQLHSSIDSINTKLDEIQNSSVKIYTSNTNSNIEVYLCPYCSNGLTVFSSSGVGASVAQLKCDYCGFSTPEVRIDKPNKKSECIEKCKENFRNNVWEIGERW